MTDDALYALYAELTHPALAGVTAADSVEPAFHIAMTRPMRGAQFGPIGSLVDWGWDTFTGGVAAVFGAGESLLRSVSELFFGLWRAIWTGIGGGIVWSKDRLGDHIMRVRDFTVRAITSSRDFVYDTIIWGYVNTRTWVQSAINTTAAWGQAALDWIRWFATLVSGAVASWGQAALNWIEWGARFAVDTTITWGQAALASVASWGQAALDWILWFATLLGEQITSAATALADAISDAAGWLWDRFSTTIQGLVVDFVSGIRSAFEWFSDHIFGPVVDGIMTKVMIPGKILRGQYGSAEELFEEALDPLPFAIAPLIAFALVAFLVLPLISNLATATAAPLFEPAVQRVRARVQAGLPTVGEIMEGRNRGFLDEGNMRGWLLRHGLGDEQVELLDQMRRRIPGSGDLVRFAVREAFDEGLATELGFVSPPPGEFASWLDKQGFDSEWADRFWWSHWDLPSVNQGFEMFHRNVITEPELRTLLRVLDLPPLWHDRFIDIAFRPFTRVDVRRMHLLGILDREGVKRSYLDLGFSPEKAEAQTEFTIRYNDSQDRTSLDDQRELAAGAVLKAYKRRVLGRQDAFDRLVELRFHPDDAEIQLAIADVDLSINPFPPEEDDIKGLARSTIVRAYRDRIFSREQAQAELEVLGFLPDAADVFLSLEDFREMQELRQLEERVIELQLKGRLITAEDAGGSLDAAGVAPERSALLLQRWTLQIEVRELQDVETRAVREAREIAGLAERVIDLEFRAGELDEAAAGERLAEIGVGELRTTLLINRWTLQTRVKEKSLSRADIRDALGLNLIDAADARRRLSAAGWNDVDREIIMAIAAPGA